MIETVTDQVIETEIEIVLVVGEIGSTMDLNVGLKLL